MQSQTSTIANQISLYAKIMLADVTNDSRKPFIENDLLFQVVCKSGFVLEVAKRHGIMVFTTIIFEKGIYKRSHVALNKEFLKNQLDKENKELGFDEITINSLNFKF